MISLENVSRLDDVDALSREDAPRQRHQPVQISTSHCVLGGGGRHPAQTANFTFGFFFSLFRHAGCLDLFAQFFDFTLGVVAFTEFALNRSKLLTEKILALTFAHFLLDLTLNLASKFQDFEFLRKFRIEKFEPLSDGDLLENELLRNDRQIGKIRRNVIAEPARVLDVDDNRLKIIGQLRRQFNDAFELAEDRSAQRLEVHASFVFLLVAETAILARRYGSNCTNSFICTRETPMMITKRLPSGVFITR